MEIAFFQIADSNTGLEPQAKPSAGEEFSFMLASFMPQSGQHFSFSADAPEGASSESGLDRSFFDGSNATVAFKDDFSTSPVPVEGDLSGVEGAEGVDFSGMIDLEGVEAAEEAQAPELAKIDGELSGGLELLSGPEETGVESPAEANATELSEMTEADAEIAFSGGFENNANGSGTDTDGGPGAAITEPIQVKQDAALNGAPFVKHLDTASVEQASNAPKSAPVGAQVADAVEAGIRLSADAEGGEVRMKLNPESLGEVRIKLDVSSGTVRAEITVERPEVKAMIEADSALLRDSLGAHGLTLDKCVVEVAKSFDMRERPEGFWKGSDGQERASGNRGRENGGNRHGRFEQEKERGEERGVDFFI